MDITWYGLACFRLRGKQLTVVCDPYDSSVGLDIPRLRANVVTVSHDVPGHNHVKATRGCDHLINAPGEFEVNGVFVTGVTTYHKGKVGERERNTAFVIEYSDATVCHLGDLGALPGREQVELLSQADVLLLPVGGGDILDAGRAVEVVTELEPKIVIPMHYATPGIKFELDGVEKFLKEMGIPAPEPLPLLRVGRSDIAGEETQVVLLQPQGESS